jgi:hypothetical protein
VESSHFKLAQESNSEFDAAARSRLYSSSGWSPELIEAMTSVAPARLDTDWSSLWAFVWLTTDMAHRMSARLCGLTLPDSHRHGTDCALQRQPEPKLADCGWRTRHKNLDFCSTHLIYDTRPCTCSKCVLCASPADKAKRRLWVCVEENIGNPLLSFVNRFTGLEPCTYFKAFLPDPAVVYLLQGFPPGSRIPDPAAVYLLQGFPPGSCCY